MRDFKVTLTARNEGIRYSDDQGVYHFNCNLDGKRWVVSLPPSKGDRYESHALSPEERRRIIPRVTTFLTRIWWCGVWPVRYEVAFVEKADSSN
jgi:hypothetical protein